eukprot:CAMPEP_0194279802 /NCGR_PEP_ID=MMETSP0169-20130528/14135_1 /TAXON_ID=218684 /ORGANISM="Corethron pennatum, Strain L29A3" /LENGTH=348 /DNA_ID=CAMNT_0039024271 /DNA_START=193 /DNA_END=1240 /DNA_ORIENTATION=-
MTTAVMSAQVDDLSAFRLDVGEPMYREYNSCVDFSFQSDRLSINSRKLRRLNAIFERAADRSSRGIREDKLLEILPSGMAPKFKLLRNSSHTKDPSQDPGTNENHHPNRVVPSSNEPVSSYRFISRGTFLAMFALESSAFINTTAQNEIVQRKIIQKKHREKRQKNLPQPLVPKNASGNRKGKKKTKKNRPKRISPKNEDSDGDDQDQSPADSDDSSTPRDVYKEQKREERKKRLKKIQKREERKKQEALKEIEQAERMSKTMRNSSDPDECQFLRSVAKVLRNCFQPTAPVGIAPLGDDGQDINWGNSGDEIYDGISRRGGRTNTANKMLKKSDDIRDSVIKDRLPL